MSEESCVMRIYGHSADMIRRYCAWDILWVRKNCSIIVETPTHIFAEKNVENAGIRSYSHVTARLVDDVWHVVWLPFEGLRCGTCIIPITDNGITARIRLMRLIYGKP